jgi:hypothetical protein
MDLKLTEAAFGLFEEFIDTFDGKDTTTDLTENGCLIATATANLQYRVHPFELQVLCHFGYGKRRGDPLAGSQRESIKLVGEVFELIGDKSFTINSQKGLFDMRIEWKVLFYLLDKILSVPCFDHTLKFLCPFI